MEKYKDQMEGLFINAGTQNKAEMKEIMEIASVNNVTDLPSVLLLNNKGAPVKVIAGMFDNVEMEKAIQEVIK